MHHETWSHSQTSVIAIWGYINDLTFCGCGLRGVVALYPGHVGGEKIKCPYEAKKRTYVPEECKFLEVLPVKVGETVPLTREG